MSRFPASHRSSRPGPRCCASRAETSAGMYWPTRRETSSARSPGDDGCQP
jgi:hypothetical protein